jgi:ribose transport system substrate-binding protein
LNGVKDGTLDSTILLAPQYSGFWKAWVPFRVAMGEDVGDQVLIQGVLVTPENVDPVIQLAQDQVAEIEEFPSFRPVDSHIPFSRPDGRRGRGMRGEAERQHCCL